MSSPVAAAGRRKVRSVAARVREVTKSKKEDSEARGQVSKQVAEVHAAVDKLMVAAQGELGPPINVLLKHMQEDEMIKVVQQKIIEHETIWLGVMHQACGENAKWCPELVPFFQVLLKLNNPQLHSVLISSKLNSLLSVPQLPKETAVGILLQCLSNEDNIKAILSRMSGLENILAALVAPDSTPMGTYSLVMLVANVLGRHPPSTMDMVKAKVDQAVSRIGIQYIREVSANENAKLIIKAVLYCLRFFVRSRHDDATFVETCLSLSVHSVGVLLDEATELCGDMCAVVKNFAFAKKSDNIFMNLVGIVPKIKPTRTHHVLRFLTNYIPHAPEDRKKQFGLYCVMSAIVLFRREFPSKQEPVSQFLEMLVTVYSHTDAATIESRMDFQVLAQARDVVLANEEVDTDDKLAFFRIQHALVTNGNPVLGMKKVYVPVAAAVDHHISHDGYNHIYAEDFEHSRQKSRDSKIASWLSKFQRLAASFEEGEGLHRQKEHHEEIQAWSTIVESEERERQQIANSKPEQWFRLLDRTAILFAQQLSLNQQSAREEFVKSAHEATATAKKKFADDYATLTQNAQQDLEAATKRSSHSEHEIGELKHQFKLRLDDQRKRLRDKRDSTMIDRKWRASQGGLAHKLMDHYLGRKTKGEQQKLIVLELKEEIVRGHGYFGINDKVPENDLLTSVVAEERIAWRGIMRQVQKVVAPQMAWIQQCRENLQLIEDDEQLARLTVHAGMLRGFIQMEAFEAFEWNTLLMRSVLYGSPSQSYGDVQILTSHHSTPQQDNYLPSNPLYFMGSFSSFSGAPDTGLGVGLRAKNNRRRSQSIIGSSLLGTLDDVILQEEAIREGDQESHLRTLWKLAQMWSCILSEFQNRAVLETITEKQSMRLMVQHEEGAREAIEGEQYSGISQLCVRENEIVIRISLEDEEAASWAFIRTAFAVPAEGDLADDLLAMIALEANGDEDLSLLELSASESMMMSF